jgi:hypothetical protein
MRKLDVRKLADVVGRGEVLRLGVPCNQEGQTRSRAHAYYTYLEHLLWCAYWGSS